MKVLDLLASGKVTARNLMDHVRASSINGVSVPLIEEQFRLAREGKVNYVVLGRLIGMEGEITPQKFARFYGERLRELVLSRF